MPPEHGMGMPAPRPGAWAALVLWVYGTLMQLLAPLLKRKLHRRGQQEPGYLLHPEQRLGHYPGLAPSSGWVWVHAVSLGETRAAALLLAELRAQRPGVRVLLTHGTATGRAEGERLLAPGDLQVWQPWDTPAAVDRFLRHFRPQVGVLMETEVWPHWVQACRRQCVPLLLVNARLNERSLRAAQRLAWLARPAYAGLQAVYAQTPADAQRLRQLGAPVQGVYGNLKFDVAADAAQQARGLGWRAHTGGRPVLMLASSREGEEALWVDAWAQALQDQKTGQRGTAAAQPQPLWLVVPRHPQRFDEVAALLQAKGLVVARRSAWGSAPPPASAAQADVWLGDSLGEMQAYYRLAQVALLGGSFLPLGGQNLIEAAVCGCPVVVGPHTFNFAAVAEDALQVGAAQRVASMAEAVAAAQTWLQQPAALAQAQAAGPQWLAASRGASQRCATAILSHVPA